MTNRILVIAFATAMLAPSAVLADSGDEFLSRHHITARNFTSEKGFNELFEATKSDLFTSTPEINCYKDYCSQTWNGMGITISEITAAPTFGKELVTGRVFCAYNNTQTVKGCLNMKGTAWYEFYNQQSGVWQSANPWRFVWPE